jgi:hypothetical protein
MGQDVETLDFEITLSGTYWGTRYPEFDILVDDTVVNSGCISSYPSKKGLPYDSFMSAGREQATYQTIKFTHPVIPGNHVLGIRFKNKQPGDTCEFVDGQWRKDVLLNVEKIVIDGVDLRTLIYNESTYTFDQEQTVDGQVTKMVENCVHLGFNGVYELKFISPFYIWLLERL